MTSRSPNPKTSLPRLRGRAGVGARIAPLLIVGYYLASVLGHLEISLWLVQRRESDLLGSYKLADFLPHAGALLSAAVVIWQSLRARRGSNHALTLAAWAAWLAAVIAVDRLLIYSFPEYLHYPQYALLAWMIARFVDPDRTAFAIGPVLLAVTLLGIADEALQFTWITTSYSNYLDFNDFLLNLLGGIAGLLIYYGFAPGSWEKWTPGSRIELGMTPARSSALYGIFGFACLGTAMLLAVAVIYVTSPDPKHLQPIERQPSYGTWIPGPHAGRYYVLDPVTGTLLLAGLGVLVSAAPIMGRRN